ncbi:MAG: cupin domain-containing protein [Longimicrobiales bacterium]|nr:cupin domain-containing protein [Longimicrobiales bacterium]
MLLSESRSISHPSPSSRATPETKTVPTIAGILALLFGLAFPASAMSQQPDDYARSSDGIRVLELGGGTTIEVLLDASNLGTDALEVAEITFPVGLNPPRGHAHGAMEIFYVVEGVLGHVVNGEEHRLEPGLAGVVKPGDEVIHRVLGDQPVKALVIWVPGGEADRIAPPDRWRESGG